MSPLSDDELRNALARRVSASRLTPAERESLRREIATITAFAQSRPTLVSSRFSRRLAAAALVGAFAVIAGTLLRPSLPDIISGQPSLDRRSWQPRRG